MGVGREQERDVDAGVIHRGELTVGPGRGLELSAAGEGLTGDLALGPLGEAALQQLAVEHRHRRQRLEPARTEPGQAVAQRLLRGLIDQHRRAVAKLRRQVIAPHRDR